MKYTKENIQEGIVAKTKSLSLSEEYTDMLIQQLLQYPVEIEQNIIEWVNDIPLTQINCHEVSMQQVMAQWNLPDKAIPDLILGFINYQNTKWRIPQKVWLAVAGWRHVHD